MKGGGAEMRNHVPNITQPQNEEEDNEEQPLPRASRNRTTERYGNPYSFNTTEREEIAD